MNDPPDPPDETDYWTLVASQDHRSAHIRTYEHRLPFGVLILTIVSAHGAQLTHSTVFVPQQQTQEGPYRT